MTPVILRHRNPSETEGFHPKPPPRGPAPAPRRSCWAGRWDRPVFVAENFAAAGFCDGEFAHRREQLAARRGVSDTWAYQWARQRAGRVPGPAPPDDEARADAAQAVTALYETHAVGLIRLAVVMLGDRAAAEDVVQEAFCGLYRRWDQLADPARR